VALADDIARVVYIIKYNQQYVCNFPYVLLWYFICSAYIIALHMWIRVYFTVSKQASHVLLRVKIAFIALDVIILTLLLTAASLWQISADSDTGIPDAIYVVVLAISAIGISALFTFYGVRIVRRLGQGRKMRLTNTSSSSRDDRHLYKVTIQIITLSATCFTGALIAVAGVLGVHVLTSSAVFADVIIKVIQYAFEIAISVEMMYMVKPKVRKLRKDINLEKSRSTATIHSDNPSTTDSSFE